MSKLTPITANAHGNMQIAKDNFLIFARDRHMLALRVTEVPRAIVDFPVLISRHQHDGSFALSALTSLEAGKNLYFQNGQWDSSFRTAAMATYPLFLMADPDGSDAPVLGVDDSSPAIVKQDGHALFDQKGKVSLWQDQQEKVLVEDGRNSVLTQRFLARLNELGLFRDVTLNVHFADEEISQIRGLYMINEDNLQALSPDQLSALKDHGYLPAIYAMLFSVFQLNNLILRHNKAGLRPIVRINLEVAKPHQS